MMIKEIYTYTYIIAVLLFGGQGHCASAYVHYCRKCSFCSEGSCAIAIDPSHSEGVACGRSESSSSEALTHHLPRDPIPTLFLELHYIASDDTIALNAVNNIPGHCDCIEGDEGRQTGWNSSGFYSE